MVNIMPERCYITAIIEVAAKNNFGLPVFQDKNSMVDLNIFKILEK